MKLLKIVIALLFVGISLWGCSRPEDQPSEYYKQGQVELEQYNYSKALEQFKLAINDTPEQIEPYTNAVDILLLKGQFDQAKEILNLANENIGKNEAIIQRYGLIEHRLGNYEQALGYYEEALQLEDGLENAIIGKAKILAIQEKSEDLKKHLSNVENNEVSEEILFLQGVVLREEEVGKKTLETLANSKTSPFSTSAGKILEATKNIQANEENKLINLANIAFTLINNGYFEFAMPLTTQIIAENDLYATGFLYRGLVLLETYSYEDALSNINQAIRIDPSENTAYLLAAEADFRLGKNNAALANINNIAGDIKNSENSDLLLRAVKMMTEYEESDQTLNYIENYQETNEELPLELKIEYLIALVLNEKYEEAETVGEEALAAEDNMNSKQQAQTYSYTGYAKFKTDKKSLAFQYYEKAQSLNVAYPVSYYYEGKSYLEQSEINSAKEALERTVELDLKDQTNAKELLEAI